ncbi:hypothetical protein DH2020_042493 [Rehmannia glutinosa]|uniref:CASP-like protein n=1 Tax=Rehmannia glutinosa TaxID=99300 RepID=A0ABR0UNL9_REHGL
MPSTNGKSHNISPLKTQKIFFVAQITLRILATATTLAATWIMLTTKQTQLVFGIQVDARYSYSPAFKFFAYANLVACASTVLSLFVAFILGKKAVDPTYHFYMFLHDLQSVTWGNMETATQVGWQCVAISPNSAIEPQLLLRCRIWDFSSIFFSQSFQQTPRAQSKFDAFS